MIKADDANKQPQPTPLDSLLSLFWGHVGVPDAELFEAEKHEIDELEAVISQASLYRSSNVSRAQFNKFNDIDNNRQIGERMRQESAQRREQRAVMCGAHQLAGYERAQRSREQRECVLARVRQHREENQMRGMRVKGMRDELLSALDQQRAEWRTMGAAHAGREGRLEHQRRLREIKDEMLAERHEAATEVKLAREQRLEAEREAAVMAIESNRQRVDRVREETKAEAALATAEALCRNRQATADLVRDAKSGWASERSARRESFLAAVRAKRRESLEEQRGEDGQLNGQRADAQLLATRKLGAAAMRTSLAHLEARDRMQRLSLEASKRELHDEHYEARFVDRRAAARVQEAAHTALANAHRDVSQGSSAAVGRWITGQLHEHFGRGEAAGTGAAADVTADVTADAAGPAAGRAEPEGVPKLVVTSMVASTRTPSIAAGRPNWKPSLRSSGWFTSL